MPENSSGIQNSLFDVHREPNQQDRDNTSTHNLWTGRSLFPGNGQATVPSSTNPATLSSNPIGDFAISAPASQQPTYAQLVHPRAPQQHASVVGVSVRSANRSQAPLTDARRVAGGLDNKSSAYGPPTHFGGTSHSFTGRTPQSQQTR